MLENRRNRIVWMIIVVLVIQIMLPLLTAIVESEFSLISKAEEVTEYYINSAQDLWDFAEQVNNGNTFQGTTVYLTTDIDLGCSEDNQWIPIGDYSVNTANVFKGTFDGQNNYISSMYINTDKEYQGLFGYNTGTIKNVKVNNGIITTSGSQCGGIVGFNSGNIVECLNEIELKGIDNLGGICGRNLGTINLCCNKGKVSGIQEFTGEELGGIAGYNGGKVIDSVNHGTINGNEELDSFNRVGGIVGFNSRKLISCQNNGEVKNRSNTGGIAGYNNDTIISCENIGNVTGKLWIGGIAGQNDYRTHQEGYAIIRGCLNSGKIVSYDTLGNSYIGGIAGSNQCAVEEGRVIIIECCNVGEIEGAAYAGRNMW